MQTKADPELAQVIGKVLCTLTSWKTPIERAMLDADIKVTNFNKFLADLADTLIHLQPED